MAGRGHPINIKGIERVHIFQTILPVFAVIMLGSAAKHRGYLPSAFLEPANRLVYYFAIPAMIFRAVAKGSLKVQFEPRMLAVVLLSVVLVFGIAWVVGGAIRLAGREKGTFIQSAFHGNLGYIGLAVAYYALGENGLVQASILAGFIMILQNVLAVATLQICAGTPSNGNDANRFRLMKKVIGNPVIVSAIAGIVFSVTELPLPMVVGRSLDIISDMALPMALLIIGASISFNLLQMSLSVVAPISVLKLLLLPGIGWALSALLGVPVEKMLPGLILLAAPSATLTYVMAKEMGGAPELAVAAVSGTTLASALTMALWLNVGY